MEGEEWRRKIKEVERKIEIKERERRRKNIIVREVEDKKGKSREAVEKIFKDIEMKVKIEEARKKSNRKKSREGQKRFW